MPIRVLPPSVAARIAAGEVIERPASVVKELVENALDAGATRIAIALGGGGIDSIVVADNGHGIAADEVHLAFARHATSKLAREEDLGQLRTLGFRGEALPSIAAVADVSIATRAAGAAQGVRLRLENGQIVERREIGRPVGTTVEVLDLFARQPARRKFLRTAAGETAAIAHLVGQLALAFPEVAFELRADERLLLVTDGLGDRASAARRVLGQGVARDLLPVEWSAPPDWSTSVRVRGLAGLGSAHRGNRSGMLFFVNRRLVQSRALAAAVDEVYQTLVPTGRHPIVVLDVDLDPADVDANVHPAKLEVRLLHERVVLNAVQRALRAALSAAAGPQPWGGSESGDQREQDAPLRGLRVLGQVGQTYIIAEGQAGLYLVDQHAAHERVLYEELSLAELAGGARQMLLEPLAVDLPPATMAAVEAHRLELLQAGFDVEPFGEGSVVVRSVPAIGRSISPVALAREVLSALNDEGPPDDWRERIRTLASCKAAVRAGDALTHEEMLALLERLGEAELCRTCSHGRPTALLLSHRQLEKEFGRR